MSLCQIWLLQLLYSLSSYGRTKSLWINNVYVYTLPTCYIYCNQNITSRIVLRVWLESLEHMVAFRLLQLEHILIGYAASPAQHIVANLDLRLLWWTPVESNVVGPRLYVDPDGFTRHLGLVQIIFKGIRAIPFGEWSRSVHSHRRNLHLIFRIAIQSVQLEVSYVGRRALHLWCILKLAITYLIAGYLSIAILLSWRLPMHCNRL